MSRKTPLPDDTRVLLALAADYIHVFQYDMDNDKTSLVLESKSKDEKIAQMEDKGFKEAFGIYIDNFVYPEDREMMRSQFSLPQIMMQVTKNNSYCIDYRDAEGRFCECKMALVWRMENQLSIGFADIDHQVRYQKELLDAQEHSFATVKTLASEYSSVAFVNLEDEKVSVYSMYEGYAEDYKKLLEKGINYTKAIRLYAREYVYENDLESFLNSVSTENIKNELLNKKRFEMLHRVVFDGRTIRYARIVFVKLDDVDVEPTAFAIAFDYDNDRVIGEYIRDKLVNEYLAVYFLDLDNNLIHCHKPSRKTEIGQFVSAKYDETCLLFSREVAPENRQMFENLSRASFVREFLKESDMREYTYQIPGRKNPWRRCVFQVIERRDGEASTLVVSFTTMDNDSISERIKVNRVLAEQEAELQKREELEEINKKLSEAMEMVKAANKAKTMFLNSMSNDIRNPMNSIIEYTELANKNLGNKAQVQGYLKKISHSSMHLLSLINDILDMTRIESGKMNINDQPESLFQILHELNDIVIANVRAKDLKLFIDASKVKDEIVMVDKVRFSQVFLNVLFNSVKYTNPGGKISVKVVQKSVSNLGYGRYEITIQDTGIGMSKEYLKTIFDPFSRASDSEEFGEKGSGLGLTITKNIIDMVGGTIDIESEEGVGTKTTICFDIKIVDTPDEAQSDSSFYGKRALVVDNDPDTCKSLSLMLRNIGLDTQWCLNGTEAALRAEEALENEVKYDYFIVNWQMPDSNGSGISKKLRSIVGDNVPIILTSSYDWNDIENEAKDAMFNVFIQKPLFPSDLRRVLLECNREK